VDILLLHNPVAGDDRPSESRLVDMLRSAGHEVASLDSEHPDLGQRLVDKVDLLLIAGGDGTVAKVLEKVEGASAPLGILPLGTANNLARALGIAGEIPQIIAGLAEGELVALDFGIADGPWGRRRFFESAGFGAIAVGLGPVNSARVSSAEKIPSGRRALREVFATMAPAALGLTVDGERTDEELLMLELSRIDSVGPRLLIAPQAAPGDGFIHLASLAADRRDEMLRWLDDPEANGPAPLRLRRARQVEVAWQDTASHVDDYFFEAPGQPARMKAWVEAAAVRMLVPAAGSMEVR
jgi:diacylglycerol kinase family enzyme